MTTDNLSSRSEVKLKLAYMFLSMLSGLFELGSVVLLIFLKMSILQTLLAGLAYQLGNLSASTIRLTKKSILLIVMASTFLICFYIFDKNILFYYASMALISVGLQKTRRLILETIGQDQVSTFSKRLVRILGFVMAGVVSTTILLAGIIATLVTIFLTATYVRTEWQNLLQTPKPRGNILAGIMVVHQSHYFSYAFWMPIIFISKLRIPTYLVGLSFILGWLSYIYTERLLGGFKETRVFIAGHIIVAISLTLIGFFTNNMALVLIAWFISGLGGGSVYCLKRLNKNTPIDLDVWEDIGHVTGVLLSVLLTFMLTENFYNPFFVSATIALITALLMFLLKSKIA